VTQQRACDRVTPQVKNVELKKLVYMYLVHNADANSTCRELALLAINSFQRDLSGPNQVA
jgi:AP-3 complex subunit beta